MTEFERLDAVQDELHQCILNAKFNDLPRVLKKIEGLSVDISTIKNRDAAEKLRDKAERNSKCLLAAARGIRSAQRRLGDVTSATTKLSTYTVRGQRDEVEIQTGTLAKRL